MNFKYFLVLSICLCFLISCDKKHEAIDDLSEFTEKLETESNAYTPQDWDVAAKNFESIDQNIKQYKYSDEELKEIGRLKGKCYAYFIKARIKEFGDEIHDFSKEIGSGSKEFIETLSK